VVVVGKMRALSEYGSVTTATPTAVMLNYAGECGEYCDAVTVIVSSEVLHREANQRNL